MGPTGSAVSSTQEFIPASRGPKALYRFILPLNPSVPRPVWFLVSYASLIPSSIPKLLSLLCLVLAHFNWSPFALSRALLIDFSLMPRLLLVLSLLLFLDWGYFSFLFKLLGFCFVCSIFYSFFITIFYFILVAFFTWWLIIPFRRCLAVYYLRLAQGLMDS